MSDTNQEPTMEEILASIRRIISEDEPAPGQGGDGAQSAASPASENTADDEVLELTERVEPTVAEPEPMESVGDLDVYSANDDPAPMAAPEPEPEPARPAPPEPAPPAPSYSAPPEDDGLVSATAASSAAAAFGSLSQALMMPKEGRSLEDVVRELLKPLLKEWLDANLPGVVQAKVQEEVERIARTRR